MPSATETTMVAFVGLLAAAAAASDPVMPVPLRNEVMPERLSQYGNGSGWLNVLDGDAGGNDEGGSENVALGDGAGKYELSHEPQVEWICQNDSAAEREAQFDAGLIAIYDAATAEGAIDGVTVTLKSIQRSNLNTEGMPGTKAALLTFRLTFLSDRPF